MDEAHEPALAYERPRQLHRGLFAGRFVALAAVGLTVGAALLLFDGAVLVGVVAQVVRRKQAAPFEVVTSIFRVVLDGLLVAGCVGAVLRRPLARSLLTLFAKGQFVDAVVMGLAFAGLWWIWRDSFRMNPLYFWVMLVFFGARCAIAWLILLTWRGIHADFYFGTASASEPAESGGSVVAPMQLERRTARFLIRGCDTTDGREVEHRSNARTEGLARKAAAALGVDLESVTIVPIPADTPDAAAPV